MAGLACVDSPIPPNAMEAASQLNGSLLIELLEEVAVQCNGTPAAWQAPLATWPTWPHGQSAAPSASGPVQFVPGLSGSMPDVAAGAKVKKPRKRGPTTVDQVKALECKLKELKLRLKEETITNSMMNERLAMLELIISVKDDQVARIREINEGLKHNPFAAYGIAPEDLVSCSPDWLSERIMQVTSTLGTMLSSIMPVIQHQADVTQDLVQFYDAHSEQLLSGSVTVDQLATQYNSSHPHVSHKTAYDFGLFLFETLKIERPCLYIFFLAPKLQLFSSKHVESLDRDISDLMLDHHTATTSASQSGLPGSSQQGIATEAHWQEVACQIRATSQQQLQAHVLWGIMHKARSAVLQQRAALGHAMSQARVGTRTGSMPPPGVTTAALQSLGQPGQQQGLVSQGSGPDNNQAGVSLYRSAEQWLQEAQVMDKLNKNLMKERCIVALVGEVLMHRIFNTLQFGMVLVASFPYLVDELGLLHAISESFDPESLAPE